MSSFFTWSRGFFIGKFLNVSVPQLQKAANRIRAEKKSGKDFEEIYYCYGKGYVAFKKAGDILCSSSRGQQKNRQRSYQKHIKKGAAGQLVPTAPWRSGPHDQMV